MSFPDSKAPALAGWIEERRLPDPVMGAAYEDFGAQARGFIKNAIALADFYYTGEKPCVFTVQRDNNLGFSASRLTRPSDWTALIYSADFDAAALSCAAAIAPMLCGVPLVFAVCLAAEPSPSILTSLELCGVEDIFILDNDNMLKLAASLASQQTHGRALVLDSSPDGGLQSLASGLSEMASVKYWGKAPCICVNPPSLLEEYFKSRPSLLSNIREPALASGELLKIMYGSNYSMTENPELSNILFTDSLNSAIEKAAAPLALSPGCIGFWLFPGLSSEFFQVLNLGFENLSQNISGAFEL